MKPKTVGRIGGDNPQARIYAPYAFRDTGLLQGTMILTLEGEISAESVSVGDKVITRDSGTARVEYIQRTTRMVHTIAVAAGSLGDDR